MFNLLKRNLPSLSPKTAQEKKEHFFKLFLEDGNHRWIAEDKRMARGMAMLIHAMQEVHIDFFIKHPTYLIPCQAQLSCAIGSTKNHHLILVFPELIKMLKSSSIHQALAVLAHELGHVYYEHTENKVDTLQAQIEADDFAFQLGFGEELQEVLLDHVHSVDCRVRIAKLTAKLMERRSSQ